MKRTIAIGDIHECYQTLVALLSLINYNSTDDQLIFLGDYIDRGLDACKTLRQIKKMRIQLGREKCVCLQKCSRESPLRKLWEYVKINAMAADIDGNIIDHFGGIEDLEKGIIRCVGNPEERFNEDALRILRALRFAFKYNFQIEEYTNTSLLKKAADLKFVANERIQKEFNQILEYGSFEAMIKYKNILFEIIPELKFQDDYDQKNPYHNLNLLEHTFKTYAQAKKIGLSDIVLILAALLHDIGKPFSQTIDEDNVAHYYEHTKIGEEMSKSILKRLRYENHIVQDVSSLIKYHDAIILPRKNVVKRWLRKIGDVQFKRLILLKKADILAQDENHISRINQLKNVEIILDDVLDNKECFNISHLSINGKDVMDVMHINEGRRVGEILNLVLEEVISNKLSNNREDIIRFIKKLLINEE